MYFRKKKTGRHTYLQIVEGHRDKGKVRQRVIATVGRLDRPKENGHLEGLLTSGARFSEKVSVVGEHKRGHLETRSTKRIGPGLVFARLWEEAGIGEILRSLLSHRRYRFDIAGAIFLTVVHRLLDPGSDRAAEKWRRDYMLPGVDDGLDLHHLYRSMAWLGEELPASEQTGRTPFAPRCVKDLLEERLFLSRRDLFSEFVIAFFDTTSLYFEGSGGDELGRRGKNKDHRPDLKQMVVGLVLDGEGRPICCELWPGNTTDVTTLLPIVDRLRTRFRIKKICIVADRGMISGKVLAGLESRKDIEYILGARMRKQKEVKYDVLSRAGRYREVHPPRRRAKDPSPLQVKEVIVGDHRYVVCYNEEQARKDAADREAIVRKLKEKLTEGDKALVGNKGFKRYLQAGGAGFEVDEEKIRTEARYDGKWVLRTNADMNTEQVALTYKQLWMVESLFRSVKSVLETRPIYHKSTETIRGHVFCSFLALVMMRALQDRMDVRGWDDAEWDDVLKDLETLDEDDVLTGDGKRFLIRSELKGWCGKAFQAAGVAIPPTIRFAERETGS
jgi:hypothetical protein